MIDTLSFYYAGGPAFICCLIISFAPYFLHINSWEDANYADPIKSALASRSFGYSLVAGIAATFPPLIELLFAALFSKEESKKRPLLTLSLLICLVIPEFISLFHITAESDSKLHICLWSARLILSLFLASIFLCQFSQTCWRNKWLTLSVSCIYIGLALIPLSPYLKTTYQPLLQNFGSLIQVTGCIIFFVLSYSFLRNHPKNDGTYEHMSSDVFFCRFANYCIIFIILSISLLHGAYKFPYWKECTGDYLTIYTFILATPNIAISVAFTHVSRNEAYFLQEVKQMFVRYISHEMRTPLNTAVMGLQYLRSELLKSCTDTELLGIVGEVRGACEISVSILNEMLDYDKLQSGGMKLELEEISVINFLEGTISPFYVQAYQKQIRLLCDFSNLILGPLSIQSDRNKLAQVIRNLLSNALKFTPSGGTVKVITTVHKLEHIKIENKKKISPNNPDFFCTHTLRIDVIDSGPGVSKENQKKLFKEIVQFNPGKLQSAGGSGLGLYISKGIMDLHEGSSLSITSEGEGHGCTFTVILPAKYIQSSSNNNHVLATTTIPSNVEVNSSVLNNWRRSLRRTFFSLLNNNTQSLAKSSSPNNSDLRNKIAIKLEPRRSEQNELVPTSIIIPTFDHTNAFETNATVAISNFPKRHHSSSSSNLIYISSIECTTTSSSLLKVLVVDDSTSNRKMLVRLLKDKCRLIYQAVDGIDAVQQVQASMESDRPDDTFDAVLMDFVMPNMQGPEAAKCMRDLGYTGPIIGITGNVIKADRDHYISQGANIVLTKPVDIRDIEHAIFNTINSKKQSLREEE